MKFLQKTSIRGKQTFVVMLASSLALLLACAAFGAYEVMTFRATMVDDLSTHADIIGSNSSAALDFGDPKAADEALSALRAEPHIEAACIYTASGKVFAVYQRLGSKEPFVPPPLRPNSYYFSKDSLQLFRPVVRDGEYLGTVCVIADLNALHSRLTKYAFITGGVFFVSALAAFLLSSWLQKLFSGPILSLVQTAHAVTVGKNYSVRAVKQSDDELGVLIDAFNEMLRQIQERDAALQGSQAELEKRVEERTREAAESLSLIRATLESTTDGILAVDGHGKTTGFNQKFLEIWQVPPEIMASGKTAEMRQYVLPQLKDPDAFLSKIEVLYKDVEIESFDLLEFKDGRVFERYSKPQRIGEKSIGRVWSFRDITERKRVEIELAFEHDLLRTLLDSSPDKIYFKDTQSRFLIASKSMARMVGMENPEDLIGKTDFDLYSEEHARPAFEDEQEIIRTGRPLASKMEKEIGKDGQVTWVITSKMPFYNRAGEVIGTFGSSKDITIMKEAEIRLEKMHRQLIDTSRQAGMAEVATSVLHNVGNVLNSINVSSTLVSNRVKKSKAANLAKVVEMLNEHAADLGTFLANDAKGKQLSGYLAQLAEHLVNEQEVVLKELALLHTNIEHIKDIVVMQQSYARISGVVETVSVTDLVEDALRMNVGALQRHGVEVIREFEEIPSVEIEKHKVLQILVNLVRNAKYACDESGRENKVLTLRVVGGDEKVRVSIIDNGVGIPPENMTRIFNNGFTTRKDGHGFGLHSAVLAASELGGSLSAHSDGTGKGATFILELPYKPHKK